MKVLLGAWGTRGDSQAAVALADALQKRGHAIHVAAPQFMANEAARLGLDFTPLGDDPLAWFEANPSRRHVDTRRVLPRLLPLFARQVDRQFEVLLPLAREADVVVGQALVYAASSVAEAAGVPYHYLSPNIFFFPSRHHPPLGSKRAAMPAWVNRLSWGQFRLFYNVVFRRTINRNRAGLGLPPISSAAGHVFDTDSAIAAFDPELFPLPVDVAARLPHPPVGSFPVPVANAALDPPTEQFLRGERRTVAVAFGSMPDHLPDRTTQVLIAAARAAQMRLVVCPGWAGLGAGLQNEADAHVVGDVPHSMLFPRVDVVVHHGGVGTAATAGRAGIPQVIVPHAYDQYASAHTLQRVGVAPRPLPRRELSADALAERLHDALGEDVRTRARDLGDDIVGRDSLGDAARIIERSID